MKKTLACLVLGVLFTCSIKSYGQYVLPTEKNIEKLGSQTVYIRLLNEDEKVIKKTLKDEGQEGVNIYKEWIKQENDLRQKAITKYWTLPNKIEFITISDFEAKGLQSSPFLNFYWSDQILRMSSSEVFIPAYCASLSPEYTEPSNREFYKNNNFIVRLPFRDNNLYEIDYKFICRQIQLAVNTDRFSKAMAIECAKLPATAEKTGNFKEQTLLIPRELITMDSLEIKEVYSGKLRMCSYKDIAEIAKSEKGKYYYLREIWKKAEGMGSGEYWSTWIIDAGTGETQEIVPVHWDKVLANVFVHGINVSKKSDEDKAIKANKERSRMFFTELNKLK